MRQVQPTCVNSTQEASPQILDTSCAANPNEIGIAMSSNSSAEAQPLLNSTDNMGKGLHRDHGTEVRIHVDSLHNGLSRRDKNGEVYGSQEDVVKINVPPPQRVEPQYPPEKFKTFIGFMFLAANMAWTLTVLAIVHERMPDRTKYPPLPDLFFDVFPPVDWALDVSEFIIICSVWLTIFIITMHKHRYIILRRCFVIIGLLYFMRSITMFVTQVPVASTTYYCSPKANSTSPLLIVKRVIYMMSGFGLSINGKHTFCGDYIYSGHTVILTMAYLVIKEYSSKKLVILHHFVWLSSCTGIFMVLLSRGHYTVDVVIGYYVTTRVFWIYHTMANKPSLKVPGNNNYFSRMWWFSIFYYFEKNVGGVVTWQYEWPLPWPRSFWRHTRIS